MKNGNGSSPLVLKDELSVEMLSFLGQKRRRQSLNPPNSPLSMLTQQKDNSLIDTNSGSRRFSALALNNELFPK